MIEARAWDLALGVFLFSAFLGYLLFHTSTFVVAGVLVFPTSFSSKVFSQSCFRGAAFGGANFQ